MKKLSLLVVLFPLVFSSCMSFPSMKSTPEMAEFQEKSGINPTIILRVLTWAPTPYAKEIFDGMINGTIILKYDEALNKTAQFEKSGDKLIVTFGVLPAGLNESNSWIYGSGTLVSAYHLSKDGKDFHYGFEVIRKVLKDPAYKGTPFPTLYYMAMNEMDKSMESFNTFANEHIKVGENSYIVE